MPAGGMNSIPACRSLSPSPPRDQNRGSNDVTSRQQSSKTKPHLRCLCTAAQTHPPAVFTLQITTK
uniref:Uncharacterized protein n=1 Tax=Anguilla anguilla TaxID=7936 RepID=A0A0E9U4G8_ANGAN